MDELLMLLERYSPGYRDRIEGYADWLLDELEEVFGQPLPGPYRAFAREMGVKAGPLLAHVRSFDPIRDVADLYRVVPSGGLPPRRFLFIFGDPDRLAPSPYWLDLEASSEEEDHPVVRMPLDGTAWKTKLSREFTSFQEMLFLWAMEYVHLPSFPHQARYLSGERRQTPTVEDLAGILEKMGFVRLPYPRYSLLFERDGAALRLYRPPDAPHFAIHVGMRDQAELTHFQTLLEDNTDLRKSLL